MAYTTIDDPAQHFNTVLFTGDIEDSDGTSHDQAVTGVGFTPDWVWHKCRSHANQHMTVDSVRGTGGSPTQMLFLNPSDNENEKNSNSNGAIESIDSDGFTVTAGNDSSSKSNNAGANGRTYVDWCWKAGSGSTSSNSDGDITSTVSVNTTAGFSIVSYTGNNTNDASIGHGLGVAPNWVIVKNRDYTGADWQIGADAIGWTKYLEFNTVNAAATDNKFYDTAPTSTVFATAQDRAMNSNGEKHIAYCFAEKKGYSKFGKYTGNGQTTNGPFVFTGFKPAWLMIKEIDGADVWAMYDNKRIGYNTANYTLEADGGGAEGTATGRMHLLSNGFKITYNWTPINTSGQSYFYMAFAESPFVNSNKVPTNAR